MYLIDFGLSKQYLVGSGRQKKHIEIKNKKRIPRAFLTGTVRYASINAHYGDQSRRDDLLSFGHLLLYFLNGGHLPWMGIHTKTKDEKYAKILRLKESHTYVTYSIYLRIFIEQF